MRRSAVTCLFIATLARLAAAPADPLWSKAVEIMGRAKDFIPGEVRLSIGMFDENGKLLDSWENHYRLSADAEGNIITDVISASRNRVDTTAKEREAQAKRDAQARSSGRRPFAAMGDDPFDPALQESVEVRPQSDIRLIDGRACASFAFSAKKNGGGAFSGIAWIERSTGSPVEVTYATTPLPVGVHGMTTTLRYGNGPSGGGFLVEVEIEASGSILFFKRLFRSRAGLAGYWRRP